MKTLLIMIFACSTYAAMAQDNNILVLSLQQAKEQGLSNRYDVQANRYNTTIAANAVKTAKNNWLPDVNAAGNVHYNTQLQATMIPAGFGGLTEPQLLALGAKNVSIFGLDLNQAIFKPVNGMDIKIARNNTELQEEKNRQYQVDIKTQIAQAYLNVQLKQLQLKIAIDDEQRYKDYYTVADATYKVGSLLENDLRKAKLDMDNAAANTDVQKQQVVLAMQNLKYQLNIPEATTLVLSDSLADNSEALVNGDEMSRTEIKQLQITGRGTRLEYQRLMRGNLPVISLHANYSQQFLNDKFNYADTKWWTPFSYVELKLNVPIAGLYKGRTSMHENKLQQQQTQLQLQQKIADVHYEVQQATTALADARHNMINGKSNYELSKLIYGTQKQQYKFGVLLYSNLLDTERSLNNAEQNYVKAIYDYMVARINYERAEGIL